MSPEDVTLTPWYKQFWPWFMIGLLASSIMFSLTYLAFSIRYFDGSVGQDYYKDGLAINAQLEKQRHAKALGLSAELRMDSVSGDITVRLDGNFNGTGGYPENLDLALRFPTDNDLDQELPLQHIRNGHYVTHLEKPLHYRWYVQLQPVPGKDAAWRLNGVAQFPSTEAIHLTPGL